MTRDDRQKQATEWAIGCFKAAQGLGKAAD
jgi:hypothetical protein